MSSFVFQKASSIKQVKVYVKSKINIKAIAPPINPNSLETTGYQKKVPLVPQIIKFTVVILKDPSLMGPKNLCYKDFSEISDSYSSVFNNINIFE